MWRRVSFLLLFTILLVSNSFSQVSLVRDFLPGNVTMDGNPQYLLPISGTLFFAADDGVHGLELWKSDGTAAGTKMVKDINPGAASGIHTNTSGFFVNLNGVLYFPADNGVNGRELWKSDGTEAGTVLVKDISPAGSGSPQWVYCYNNTIYFGASNGTEGNELWKSDGTTAGTVLVKDIRPGGVGSTPLYFTGLNGTVFFAANDGSNGIELWQTNGTEAGTMLVKDINPGAAHSRPLDLVKSGNVLFFIADNGTNGQELWKTDGSDAGTLLVKDIRAGIAGSSTLRLTDLGGILIFEANDGVSGSELWRSDGTDAGTVLVKDIIPGAAGAGVSGLTAWNGLLYFSAFESATGSELWRTDGTAAGTFLLKDIVNGTGSSSPGYFTVVNGTLFFGASDPVNGFELWKTDGTGAGTVLIKDIYPGPVGLAGPGFGDGLPVIQVGLSPTAVGNDLFFVATNGSLGLELWKSNGTAAGTQLVRDINITSRSSANFSLAAFGGSLYLGADDGSVAGNELWKSDGTSSGTVLFKDIFTTPNSGSGPADMVSLNGILYFVASDANNFGRELWKSDGTVAGTVMVKDIRPGPGHSYPNGFTNINGIIYFAADDGVHGEELWRTDGTTTGTYMVKDINPGAGVSGPGYFKAVNGVMVFAAQTATEGIEIWRSDGTEAGTYMLKDIWPGQQSSYPYEIIELNNKAYFSAWDGMVTNDLWVTDGTIAGTSVLIANNAATAFKLYNGEIYFSGTGPSGMELYKTNGTVGGTVLVKDINPGAASSSPDGWVIMNGLLYFIAIETGTGAELWKTDGTEAGTSIVKDINPGPAWGNPLSLTLANNTLYFKATDGVTGSEIWKSDGMEAGTKLVQDVIPGSGSFQTGRFVELNGNLYFNATRFPAGNELFGLCTGSMGLAAAHGEAREWLESTDHIYYKNVCEIICGLAPQGNNPVTGHVTAKVWIEPTQPAHFVKRHYELTPETNASTATGWVTLYFTQQEFTDFNNVNAVKLPVDGADAANNKANLRVGKYPGTSLNGTGLPSSYASPPVIIDPDDADITWNAAHNRWEVSFAVTGFSGLIVQTSPAAVILPLQLVTFTGNRSYATNYLFWQTAAETGTREFLLERSTDGNHFSTLTTIPAKGSGEGRYQYADYYPVSGKAYYRLRIVDLDDQYRYSAIIVLNSAEKSRPLIFPNPVRDQAVIHIGNRGLLNSPATVTDLGGKTVKTVILRNLFETVDFSDLSPGIYFIRLEDHSVLKFIKD